MNRERFISVSYEKCSLVVLRQRSSCDILGYLCFVQHIIAVVLGVCGDVGEIFYVLIKCDVMNLQTVINGRDVLWLDFSPAAV